jgi:dipeptidyl aminopeptidase/acylaminoacyl peptidase
MSHLLLLLLTAGCATAAVTAEPTRLTAAQRARDTAEAPRIRALLEAYQNYGGELSPDGTKLLFRSDRGGVSEVYLADVAHPEAPATKLVAGPERVASAVFTRDGKRVVFRKDTGADENFHVLAIGADGTGLVDLTPAEPLWRDSPLLPRARPELIVYGARKPTDYASMLVVQELAGGTPRVAYRESGPGTIVDVLPDASHALWFREAATGGHELAEIDIATGQARPISDEPAMLTTGAYAADGSRIYVATDHGSETHVVEARDRATLAVVATYRQDAPAAAEISAIVPSPRGDRVAIMVDAGYHSSVRILDATTLAVVADAQLPLGTAGLGTNSETRVRLGGGTFSDDGSHFTVNVSVPDAPDDIYLVETATGAATPLRREVRAGFEKLPRIAATIASVPAFDGLTVPVNVYLPEGWTHRMPVLVWLHGGPDASTPLEWNAWNRVFTASGYAVLEPNIRGSTGFGRAYARADDREKRVDAMRDIASVNAWARTQPWCDPDRLVIAGASFGGYYTLMALTHQPALWRAGMDLVGPSDLATMLAGGARARRYVQELGDPVADAKLLAELSPINAVDRVVAPLLVYQGANDAHVPRAHSDRMVRALRERGILVEYMLAGDEGHSVARKDNEVELLTRMLRFLGDTLR